MSAGNSGFLKFIVLLLPCLLMTFQAAASADADDDIAALLHGSWSGKLGTGRTELTIVFNFFTDEEGALNVTMDSPDQGAERIAAELDEDALPALSINIPSVFAAYSGMLYRGQIMGTFSQGGMSLPLTLTKGGLVLDRPQTPQPPFPYNTEEVRFFNAAAGATLAGTLSWPEGCDLSIAGGSSEITGKLPVAVVMVSGSGLQNRDEELFGHRPFLVIADYLARHGVAALRYDDRGFGESTGGELENATTEDFMQDALAAVEFLKGSGRFSKVGVLGHSEGASIAFMLGARGKADFVVSLAGLGVRGDKALTAQVNRIMELSGQTGTVSEEIYRQNARLEGNAWLNWFIDYDPTDDIAATGCPVMAVNGSKDCQIISSLNLEAIRAELPQDSRNLIKEYDSLNHLFQHCATGAVTEYRSIEETVSAELLADLAGWISMNFMQ